MNTQTNMNPIENRLNKYRIFLSLSDIQTMMRTLHYHIQSKGENPEDISIYKKLELAKIKIESGMLKPEFAQSQQAASKQSEKIEIEVLTKIVESGKATPDELAKYNKLVFGIDF